MTKSYPDRIADVLLTAPPAPPILRKPAADKFNVSDLTKTKLLVFHTIQATYGTPAVVHHSI